MIRRRGFVKKIFISLGFAVLVFAGCSLLYLWHSDEGYSIHALAWRSINHPLGWHGSKFNREHWMMEMSARQKARLQYLSHQCKNSLHLQPYRNPSQNHRALLRYRHQYQHTYIDDNTRLIVSTVPKSGSSNWRMVFPLLQSKKSPERKQTMAMNSRTQGEFLNAMDLYRKVIFVRDPLIRLVAVYWEMVTADARQPDYKIYKDEMRRIVRMLRGPSMKETDGRQVNATIEEFARFIVDEHQRDSDLWMPISQKYNPCLFRYDFIGKFETAEEDVEYIFRHFKLNASMANRPKLKRWTSPNHQFNLAEFYSKLPADIFQKLVAKYETDFNLFGYRRPKIAHNSAILK